MTNTTFKVTFVNSSNGDEELRRLQLPCNLTTDYQCLKTKLASYHPECEVESVFWTDEDGDDIVVDCDQDLESVVKDQGDLVKLHVSMVPRPSGDDNPVLAGLVTTAQSLGIDPGSCGQCDHVSHTGQHQQHTSVPRYMARLVAGLSFKLTRSLIVMVSLAIISGLTLILPTMVTSSLIFVIIAASVGLPLATILLGHALFLFIYCSPSYIVTLAVVWAIKTMLSTKKNYFLKKNLDYWNKTLEDVINNDEVITKPDLRTKKTT